ncbi:MAG: YbhB/YbcL family Raf kinase inhibitor-like protein [Candidatus Eremiobacteraeota bacterium]|nr:YbhB/YbcL family Raf kinase inhibitor-like protein [Candidatus Eremiobacteraeota bacterium]
MLHAMTLALTLWSPELKNGAPISMQYAWNHNGCNGRNRTPFVRWDAPPQRTATFELTVVDHDAPKPGGFLHWAVTGIPSGIRALNAYTPPGATEHKNDFGTVGWGGPCPPPGQLHHYTFTLHALDANGHVLATSHLVPVYRR